MQISQKTTLNGSFQDWGVRQSPFVHLPPSPVRPLMDLLSRSCWTKHKNPVKKLKDADCSLVYRDPEKQRHQIKASAANILCSASSLSSAKTQDPAVSSVLSRNGGSQRWKSSGFTPTGNFVEMGFVQTRTLGAFIRMPDENRREEERNRQIIKKENSSREERICGWAIIIIIIILVFLNTVSLTNQTSHLQNTVCGPGVFYVALNWRQFGGKCSVWGLFTGLFSALGCYLIHVSRNTS